MMNRLCLVIFLISIGQIIKAQTDNIVTVKGFVQTPEGVPAGRGVMIINKTTGKGHFGNTDGTFDIQISYHHPLLIACQGYKTIEISLTDSVFKPLYSVRFTLKIPEYTLENVIIRPPLSLEEIQDRKYRIDSYRYKPLVENFGEVIQHPITAIYQMFSKREEEKRQYIALLNQQEFTNWIKELTRYHVETGLFDLTEEEIADFAINCPLNKEYVKQANFYDISNALYQYYKWYVEERTKRF